MYKKEVDLKVIIKSTSFVLCALLFCYVSFFIKK
jgi:hypothetical protein